MNFVNFLERQVSLFAAECASAQKDKLAWKGYTSRMKIYDSVEAQIRQAIERGDFDNLPNKGKPIDLSGWQKTPPGQRLSYSILKNSGYSPREVHTKKEMAELRAQLENEPDEDRKNRLLKKLNTLSITDALQMESVRKKT
jgi:hypothetical protein